MLFILENALTSTEVTQPKKLECLSFCCSAPGAAPFMLSERGLKKLLNRKMKVASYNFDLNLIGNYWGWFSKARQYHATAMISTW